MIVLWVERFEKFALARNWFICIFSFFFRHHKDNREGGLRLNMYLAIDNAHA